MTSPRRLAIVVAGAVATVTLVAVGPGDIALGANPNDSNQNGNRGSNSPDTPRGEAGADDIGRGRTGHKGKQGQNGADGAAVGRRGLGRGDIDIDVPGARGRGQGGQGLRGRLTRQAQRQVRDALNNADI